MYEIFIPSRRHIRLLKLGYVNTTLVHGSEEYRATTTTTNSRNFFKSGSFFKTFYVSILQSLTTSEQTKCFWAAKKQSLLVSKMAWKREWVCRYTQMGVSLKGSLFTKCFFP